MAIGDVKSSPAQKRQREFCDNDQKNNQHKKNNTKNPSASEKKDIHSEEYDSFSAIRPPLSSAILSFLSTPPYNFPTMTPVQATTIPLFLTHHDVVVRAVTGSGKTFAFLIPVVEMILRRTTLLKGNQIGCLILEPTRELARQTHSICRDLCQACGMNEPLLLVGGSGEKKVGVTAASHDLQQFQELSSDIVVGTPGRVEDVLTRYDNVDVSELEVLILDESDVLLDMGFEVTLTSILSRLPRMRRTGLFSATNTSDVKRLCVKSGMRNPVVVDVAVSAIQNKTDGLCVQDKTQGEQVGKDLDQFSKQDDNKLQATPSTLTNFYIISPLDEKLSRLLSFLNQHHNQKVIIFFLTCACVEYYSAVLKALNQPCKGYQYEALHGKLVQKRREKAMERFRQSNGDDDNKNHAGSALLCTDVAARGLDVPDVSWTIQFDAPVDPSSYVHRVGRSARAGKFGNSLVFLTRKEEAYVDFLRLRKVPVQELPNSEICKPPITEEEHAEEEVSREGEEKKISLKLSESKKMQRTIASSVPEACITDVLPMIRNVVLVDRDILEKGTKAFTSYIRAYKEHHCGFIFRFASLDLGTLATSFSLLRLPKMPELRDKLGKLNFRPAGPEINIHAIPFVDKHREAARQKRLAAELAAGGKNAKQIKAEERAAERIRRQKEKRQAEISKGRNPNKKKGKQARIFDEWDELAKEERLYKKLRTNKITKESYDKLMHGENNEERSNGSDSDKS